MYFCKNNITASARKRFSWAFHAFGSDPLLCIRSFVWLSVFSSKKRYKASLFQCCWHTICQYTVLRKANRLLRWSAFFSDGSESRCWSFGEWKCINKGWTMPRLLCQKRTSTPGGTVPSQRILSMFRHCIGSPPQYGFYCQILQRPTPPMKNRKSPGKKIRI